MDTRFAYPPVYMTSSLTFYSDTYCQDINGLPVARIHYDPKSIKFQTFINSIDLSTYYLPDLINLLNTDEEGYKLMVKRHKKITGDVNMIDYDELLQILNAVDSLEKMSMRLQIVGTIAHSVFNDYKKLNTGVCIDGYVTKPDNLYLPSSHFMDNKVFSTDTVAEVLVNGTKPPVLVGGLKTRRYSLSGSIIYLLIYKVLDNFDFLVFMSEEPISNLITAIRSQANGLSDFDFIYTVLARTNTEDENVPYIETFDGVYLKDAILYCNETQLSKPVLQTLSNVKEILENINNRENYSEDEDEVDTILIEKTYDCELSPINTLLETTHDSEEEGELSDDDLGYRLFD